MTRERVSLRVPRPIVAGIIAVAVLDIVEPIIFYGLRGVPPIRIFQSIAAGLLGRDSYGRGLESALLGAALHLFIASAVVIVYWVASRRWPALTQRPLLWGVMYGLSVYAFMTFVVIPLSAIGGGVRIPALPALLNGVFAHIVCVGPPSAFAARAARRSNGTIVPAFPSAGSSREASSEAPHRAASPP